MLLDQEAGVGFVSAVGDVHVELIRLKVQTRPLLSIKVLVLILSLEYFHTSLIWREVSSYPGNEAVSHVLRELLVVF